MRVSMENGTVTSQKSDRIIVQALIFIALFSFNWQYFKLLKIRH